MPVKNCIVNIEPIQSGSGDPSPSNVRAISGRTGLTVTRAGKNLLPNSIQASTTSGVTFTIDNGRVIANGTASATITLNISTSCALAPGNYVLTGCPAGGGSASHYKIDIVRNGESSRKIDTGSGTTFAVDTAGLYTARIVIYSGEVCNNLTFAPMVRLSTADGTFEPYTGQTYPISWQTQAGTVYGGTLDVVSGVLTVDRMLAEFAEDKYTLTYNSAYTNTYGYGNSELGELITPNTGAVVTKAICNMLPSIARNVASSTPGIFQYHGQNNQVRLTFPRESAYDAPSKIYALGVTAVIPLKEPLAVYQLTPTEIRSLLGGNTIYSDAGSISVDYIADIKLYIDNKVAGLQALASES